MHLFLKYRQNVYSKIKSCHKFEDSSNSRKNILKALIGEGMIVYLDNSATTIQYDEVTSEMMKVMQEDYGNPSSLHRMGLNAEKIVKKSREDISKTFAVEPNQIYFNSGGTEGANAAFWGALNPILARSKNAQPQNKEMNLGKIIATRVEHPAVLKCCIEYEKMGFHIEYLDVDDKCQIDIEQLKSLIDKRTVFISIMTVNNEVGTIMPINEVANLIKTFNAESNTNIRFHTDAVQALGKVDIKNLNADIITLSGHKIHGPKGFGIMCKRTNSLFTPFVVGGGQENGFRAGTENVPSIRGMATAIKINSETFESRIRLMKECREYLLNGIKKEIDDVVINSIEISEQGCVPSILNVSFIGTRGEILLHMLEEDSIFVSTGAACSSGSKTNSHVLEAMGLSSKAIESAIRFSFSEFNNISQIDYVLSKLKTAVTRIRKLNRY